MKIRLSIDVMMLLLSTVRTAGAFTLDQRARSLGVKGLTVRYMGGGKGKGAFLFGGQGPKRRSVQNYDRVFSLSGSFLYVFFFGLVQHIRRFYLFCELVNLWWLVLTFLWVC